MVFLYIFNVWFLLVDHGMNDVYCITMPVVVFLYTLSVWLLFDIGMECCVFMLCRMV